MNKEKYYQARKMLCEYIRETAEEKGIDYNTIATHTGFSSSNISRMLSGKYSPSLDNFIKLCDAVGLYLFIIDKDSEGELVDMMRNRWGKPNIN